MRLVFGQKITEQIRREMQWKMKYCLIVRENTLCDQILAKWAAISADEMWGRTRYQLGCEWCQPMAHSVIHSERRSSQSVSPFGLRSDNGFAFGGVWETIHVSLRPCLRSHWISSFVRLFGLYLCVVCLRSSQLPFVATHVKRLFVHHFSLSLALLSCPLSVCQQQIHSAVNPSHPFDRLFSKSGIASPLMPPIINNGNDFSYLASI